MQFWDLSIVKLSEPPEITPPFIHKCKTISQVKLIHGKLLSFGILTLNLTSHLISTYISLRCSPAAVSLLRRFPPSDAGVYHWNSLIRVYGDNGRAGECLSSFCLMHSLSWTPDNYTFPFVFKACGEIASIRGGASAHALSRVTGFTQMLSSGVKPNEVTLISVLSGCASVGALMHGKEIHCYAIKHPCKNVHGDDNMVINQLIDMYAKCKEVEVARAMFDSLSPMERDVVTWTVMIGGYSQHGDANKALKLFSEMFEQDYRTRPNAFTISCALVAFEGSAKMSDNLMDKVTAFGEPLKIGGEQQNQLGT
ncbi:unnamed protein product [Thlaspi arvense]|uniref:Pentatricopeptide repeat-containing protein n=1 Tax=Thlaspi arvense TaxID=13288 RepID=A0AAU9S4M9_THLAR|nr:unnamed protein product [Thlaspi arvense]